MKSLSHRLLLVLLMAGSLLANGCGSPKAQPSPPSYSYQPFPTSDEAKEFGQRFERMIREKNLPEFEAMFDSAFLENAKEQPARMIEQFTEQHASCRFLRVKEYSDTREATALFRVIHKGQQFTYLELLLRKQDTGAVQAIDIINLSFGERVHEQSQQIVGEFLAVLPPDDAPITLEDEARVKVKHEEMCNFNIMSTALRQGDAAEALNRYSLLSPEFRKKKLVMSMYVRAASQVDSTTLQQALDEFIKQFPGDSSIDLFRMTLHQQKGEFDQFFTMADRFSKQIGGDPFLDLVKASVFTSMNELSKARELVNRSLSAVEDLPTAQGVALELSLKEKNYAKAIIHFAKLLEMKFAEEDLVKIFMLDDGFLDSPEYLDWKKNQREQI